MKYQTKLFFCLLLIFCFEAKSENKNVKIFTDRESAGWAYKLDDTGFRYVKGACTVQWNKVIRKESPDEYSLEFQEKDCPINQLLEARKSLYAALKSKLSKKSKLSTVTQSGITFFKNNLKASKCLKTQALQSKEWKAATSGKKWTPLNPIVVKLLNQHGCIEGFSKEFEEHLGIGLKVEHVEKVFTEKEHAQRFPKDVGIIYFRPVSKK